MKIEANKVIASHKPTSDGGMAKEVFIRVGITLYEIVKQPRLNRVYVKKRIVWNNETLRQDYGKDYLASVPKYATHLKIELYDYSMGANDNKYFILYHDLKQWHRNFAAE